MESGTEGIGKEAFESILYGNYRLGKAQADLDKCKEWAAMSDEERLSHADKTCTKPFEMDKSTHSCDVCGDKIPMGAKIMRCGRCDYDVCEKCHKARAQQ